MPIVLKTLAGAIELTPTPFESENSLEELIASNPNLINSDTEPALALFARQVHIGDAGILDVALVDARGRLVVVEAKLARNGQSRREVLAQAIDYVSALSLMTVDELDQTVEGALEEAIRTHCTDGDSFEECWQACGRNLRAGTVTVVVAIDEAPEDLKRLMVYFKDHTDLDIRLVSIMQYIDKNGQAIVVPRAWISKEDVQEARARTAVRSREAVPELAAVVNAYEAIADNGFECRGRSRNWRMICPPSWPDDDGVHYEFISRNDSLDVCLHLETDQARPLREVILPFVEPLRSKTKAEVRWNQSWSTNRGELAVSFPKDRSPDDVAQAMKSLIDMTCETVGEAWREIKTGQGTACNR